MTELKATPEALLVAVDFSPCAVRALDTALRWRSGNAEVTVLHVVDGAFINRIDALGIGKGEDVLERLRAAGRG